MVHQPLRLPCHGLSLDRLGLVYALAAYVWWGLVTGAYFKSVDFAEPLELLALAGLDWTSAAHRISEFSCGWNSRFAGPHSNPTHRGVGRWCLDWSELGHFYLRRRILTVDGSRLGYYINPLLSVLLGVFVLGESMTPRRWLALVVALIGAFVFASDFEVSGLLQAGRLVELPWIVVVLPLSFGLYGLAKEDQG